MSDAKQAEVIGKVVISIPKFVQKKFGKDGYKKWMEAISADAHTIYELNVKSGDWYPMKTALIEPCANIAQLFYKWDLKTAAWDVGRFSADYGINNFYKMFIKVNTSDYFFNKTTELISKYYRPISAEILDIKENQAAFRITELPDIDNTVEYRLAGWLQRALEINKKKNVNVEIPKSLAQLQPYTEFQITWES